MLARMEKRKYLPNVFPHVGRLAVDIYVNPPDKRKRDLDNIPKALLDALTHAGIWEDDSQIDQLTITRGPVIKQGLAIVTIQDYKSSEYPPHNAVVSLSGD